MDWQIKSISKKSSQSGQELKAGDLIVSIIFVNEMGELDRQDLLKSEFESENFDKKFVAKWERTVSENPNEDERMARQMALSGSEDLFISLYDDASLGIDDKETLKQMLALLLERKRILRAVGRPKNAQQKYLHISTKREFEVPQKNLDEELLTNIQSQLNLFLI